MLRLGFRNLWEFGMFFTSLLVGISMVMGVNAVNSAPNFMLKYYTYVRDSDSKPQMPTFWNNILTFYTIVTIIAQSIHEPTNITPLMCRFSLLFRLEMSCLIMLVEILIILLMPFCRSSEVGAVVGLMFAAYLGGFARAYFENTGYALFSPCPSKMLSAMLIGSSLSGAIVSILQVVLKLLMPDTHHSILIQSVLYFSLTLCIIFIAGVLLVLLLLNPFAKQFIAEFRSRRSFWHNIYHHVQRTPTDGTDCKRNVSNENEVGNDVFDSQNVADCPKSHEKGDTSRIGVASDNRAPSMYSHRNRHDALPEVSMPLAVLREHVCVEGANPNTLEVLKGDAHEEISSMREDADFITADLLLGVKIWPVIKNIYPMMFSCFFTFCVTYLIYPGLFIVVHSDDDWYTTLIMACFNFCDLIGRSVSMWKALWPSRRVIVISAVLRILFVPLILLCAAHILPGKTAVYVFTSLLALTNGFFGTLSMVYTPMSPGLKSDGEQAIAGQITGACLLFGCSIGSLLQLAEVIPFN